MWTHSPHRAVLVLRQCRAAQEEPGERERERGVSERERERERDLVSEKLLTIDVTGAINVFVVHLGRFDVLSVILPFCVRCMPLKKVY